jgi:hypothetical protein
MERSSPGKSSGWPGRIDDLVTESERIINDAFVRWTNQYATLGALRRVFDLGLERATEMLLKQHLEFFTELVTKPEHGNLWVDQARARELLPPDQIAKQMTETTAKNAGTSVRAANLVFGHAMTDALVLDCCRAATWVAPNDCVQFVEKKKVDLQSVVGESADELVRGALADFLDQLEKESLLKKADYIYARCKPEKGFSGVENYRYDRDRLEHIDEQRHDTVHRTGIKAAANYTDEDEEYLRKTGHHLMMLVVLTFGLKFDPEYMRTKMAEGT